MKAIVTIYNNINGQKEITKYTAESKAAAEGMLNSAYNWRREFSGARRPLDMWILRGRGVADLASVFVCTYKNADFEKAAKSATGDAAQALAKMQEIADFCACKHAATCTR